MANSLGISDPAVAGNVTVSLNKGSTLGIPQKETVNGLAEKLVELAADEVLKKGIASVTQRGLSEKAGASSAVITYHFGSMSNFVNDAIWHALFRGIPPQLNPKSSSNLKQKDLSEWIRVLKRITAPKNHPHGTGFYTNYARLTCQACLLASSHSALGPLIERLRFIDGWGTYRSGQTVWPDHLTVDRGVATAFGIWIKGQSIINEAMQETRAIPDEVFHSVASLLFLDKQSISNTVPGYEKAV